MKFSHIAFLILAAILAACAHKSAEMSLDETPHKVSRDYEATGDATGIRPYAFGKHTLIKFDSGKSFFTSITDEQGASVSYKMQAGYHVLDRKLDSFTVTSPGRSVRFNRIYPEAQVEEAEDSNDSSSNQAIDVLSDSENGDAAINAHRKINPSNPIYAIMLERLQQHRKLFNIASENPAYTGEELFQINSRLDLIEYKIANQDEAIVHVYFPFNNTVFNPELKLIEALLPIAKEATRINIYGRTDSKISDAANKQIAEGRANAAKKFLVNHGVSENIIYTSSRASGDFIAPIGMEEGRRLNRRVTIEVIM